MNDKFSFRWGVPILDAGHVPIYRWMLRNYSKADITREEFLFIIHIADYHYESPDGEAYPSLETIKDFMGYKHVNSVYRLRDSLIKKGMLIRTPRPGKTDIYNVQPFARRMWELWMEEQGTGEEAEQTNAATPPQHSVGVEAGADEPLQHSVGVGLHSSVGAPLHSSVDEEKELKNKKTKKEDTHTDPHITESENGKQSLTPERAHRIYENHVKQTLRRQFPAAFGTCFKESHLVGGAGELAIVQLPSRAAYEFVHGNRIKTFVAALRQVNSAIREVRFVYPGVNEPVEPFRVREEVE